MGDVRWTNSDVTKTWDSPKKKILSCQFGVIIKKFCALNFYRGTKWLIQMCTVNNSIELRDAVQEKRPELTHQKFYEHGIMPLSKRWQKRTIPNWIVIFLNLDFSFLFKIRNHLVIYLIIILEKKIKLNYSPGKVYGVTSLRGA